MSRIGKNPIVLPDKVKVEIKDTAMAIQGPKGKLDFILPWGITASLNDNAILVQRKSSDKKTRSLHGTIRAIINNIVTGVSHGFKKELEIIGVGYKAQIKGKILSMQLGFSHSVDMEIPEGLTVTLPSATKIIIEGIDKYKVGQFAANIRRVYPPEPYKGKGIRYSGEFVRKKLGKALAK